MYAVEFESSIKDGVIHIPKEYKELQQRSEVKLVIMYDDEVSKKNIKKKEIVHLQKLFDSSNNKIVATKDLAINTDGVFDDIS